MFGFGEWLQIKDRFILAIGDKFKTVNEFGGSFKIEADKLPSHIHNMKVSSGGMDRNSYGYFVGVSGVTDGTVFKMKQHNVCNSTHQGSGRKFDIIEMNIQHTHAFDVALKDDNNNFPNKDYIQPYITAYCWKRTA